MSKEIHKIKELRSWAKKHLSGTSVYHNELKNDIRFTNTGIKEFLNQPHKHYHVKNEMIKDIQRVLREAEYKGTANFESRTSHIFEIEINKDKNWLIANEYQGRGIIFYSISDSDKVLIGARKK